jgi:hypothetical protein
MNWLKIAFIIGGAILWMEFLKRMSTSKRKISSGKKATESFNKDQLKEVLASKNLSQMVEALRFVSEPIDRHMLLSKIVELSYRKRQDPETKEILNQHAQMHLKELPDLLPALKDKYGESLKEITTFKLLAIVLDEEEKYEDAIKVCEMAVRLGLEDGTKSGFKGRIERLKKKAGKTAK